MVFYPRFGAESAALSQLLRAPFLYGRLTAAKTQLQPLVQAVPTSRDARLYQTVVGLTSPAGEDGGVHVDVGT